MALRLGKIWSCSFTWIAAIYSFAQRSCSATELGDFPSRLPQGFKLTLKNWFMWFFAWQFVPEKPLAVRAVHWRTALTWLSNKSIGAHNCESIFSNCIMSGIASNPFQSAHFAHKHGLEDWHKISHASFGPSYALRYHREFLKSKMHIDYDNF